MRRYAVNSGSSEGFTLLEVVLAAVIVGVAAATVIAVYVRAAESASSARDLGVATSVARNALEEAFSGALEGAVEAAIPERPSLHLGYWEMLADEQGGLLADTFAVEVERDGAALAAFTTKRAVYIEETDGEDEFERGDDE